MKQIRNRLIACMVTGILVANTSATQAAFLNFSAVVDGLSAVPLPGITSTGTGTLSLQYDDVTDLFDIQISLSGVEGAFDPSGQNLTPPIPIGSAAHIHIGAPGEASPVHMYNTDPTVWQHVDSSGMHDGTDVDSNNIDDPLAGDWRYIATGQSLINGTVDDLKGNAYLNIHTPFAGTGELRGDVVPEPSTLALIAAGGLMAFARTRSRRR